MEQLLQFCVAHQEMGVLDGQTTMEEVVARIVIPSTATAQCAFMDGPFMVAHGGPQRARRLVSHAWKSKFSETVRNILLDAAPEELGLELRGGSFRPGDWLVRLRASTALQATYWICAFALNQHRTICGTCWSCHEGAAWRADSDAQLRVAPACALCQRLKPYPCPCGLAKWQAADADYQIDKFDLVILKMEAVVVSLDTELKAVRRLWVIAEIAEAAKDIPVFFRQVGGMGAEPAERLWKGEPLAPAARDGEALCEQDRARVLEKVASSGGSEAAADALVRSTLELSFGRASMLARAGGAATEALARLSVLNMDLGWARSRGLTSLEPLLGDGRSFQRLRLKAWRIDASDWKALEHLAPLAVALETQHQLQELRVDLAGCGALGDAAVAALGTRLPGQLRRLALGLGGTGWGGTAASALAAHLPGALEELELRCGSSDALTDAAAKTLARGLPRALKKLQVWAEGPWAAEACAALGDRLPSGLASLDIRLSACDGIEDNTLGALGEQLPPNLRRLTLHLDDCAQAADPGLATLAECLPAALEELRLSLSTTAVSEQGALALAAKLPPGLRCLVLRLPVACRAAGLESAIRSSLAPGARIALEFRDD